MKKVKIKGVLPKSVVFKTVKKDQSSFRITKKLLDGVYNKSVKLGDNPEIRITIPINNNESYVVTCSVTKTTQLRGVN